MVISLKKFIKPVLLILAISSISVAILAISTKKSSILLGGFIHSHNHPDTAYRPVFNENEEKDYKERFQRPSKQPALNVKYRFRIPDDFDASNPPYISPGYPAAYDSPRDVIYAYYSILKESSNMSGYHGGCGTIGLDKIPYPFAYELFSTNKKQQLSLDEFIKSFSGIGHITLLKLYPAYKPTGTPDHLQYFMVEIEVITGPPYNQQKLSPSYFAYYYGLITTTYTPSDGWKIQNIDYIPEDFLCAPYHHWNWDAKYVVEIIYKDWYGLIDEVERIEKEDAIIHVYSKDKNNNYRFDFIRLTNGYDILLHEYIQEKDQWKEVNLLKEEHQNYKFSAQLFKG